MHLVVEEGKILKKNLEQKSLALQENYQHTNNQSRSLAIIQSMIKSTLRKIYRTLEKRFSNNTNHQVPAVHSK
jgi:hypothetical protein